MKKLRFIFLFCIFFTFTRDIFAAQDPVFEEKLPPTARLKISKHLSDGNLSFADFLYAQIDLNDDNFPEYLLKKKECANLADFCNYMILAEKEDKIIQLLDISAKKIAISDSKTHGIHDILAIQSKKNDYKYDKFIWFPAELIFKPADMQIEGQ